MEGPQGLWTCIRTDTPISWLKSELLQKGFICLSMSPISSLVLLVWKKDRLWRFFVDYHALNAITVHDRFPISTKDEFLNELHGAKISHN